MEAILQNVCSEFKITGTFLGYEEINFGNINKTFRVDYLRENGEKKSFLLQRLNMFVFKNPQQVMKNIELVSEYIRGEHPEKINLHFHHIYTGENYYVDETGFWRMVNWIESVTYNTCDDLGILRNAGGAFGRFQKDLTFFNAYDLFETIKDFHNTPKRINQLLKDAANSSSKRVLEVADEIEYIKTVKDKACVLMQMHENGELPLRATHNDTKINNVLFDKQTKEALTVIDLDTVMPGLVGNDFGDAIRFATNFVAEDSDDYENSVVDMEKFKAFTEGFLSVAKDSLTENEIKTLPLSCFTITIELASRFLNDYINGDNYFKILYPKHNLVRARCQIALAKDMMKKQDEMSKVIYDYLSK